MGERSTENLIEKLMQLNEKNEKINVYFQGSTDNENIRHIFFRIQPYCGRYNTTAASAGCRDWGGYLHGPLRLPWQCLPVYYCGTGCI